MTPTVLLVLAIAFYVASDLVIFFRQRGRIARLKAELDRQVDEVTKADGLLIQAEAEVEDRDRQFALLEAELKEARELPASLREKIRQFRIALSALTGCVQANLSYMDGDDLQHLVDAQLARRKVTLETTRGLEAELKARIETDNELSAAYARALAERDKYRAQADQLGGMNERIERRLTAEVEAEKARAEKRARDGYSKGYALGQADAFEKVRQLLPVESA